MTARNGQVNRTAEQPRSAAVFGGGVLLALGVLLGNPAGAQTISQPSWTPSEAGGNSAPSLHSPWSETSNVPGSSGWVGPALSGPYITPRWTTTPSSPSSAAPVLPARRENSPLAATRGGREDRTFPPAVTQVDAREGESGPAAPGLRSVGPANRLPGKERVFRLESEEQLRQRMRQEALQENRTPPRFPAEPVLQGSLPCAATAPKPLCVEPNHVYYRRLMFEDKNSERYGWELGPLQPLVSTGDFYWNVATALGRRLIEPCRIWENSAGYCLPGDPAPYMIYLPIHSVTVSLPDVTVSLPDVKVTMTADESPR